MMQEDLIDRLSAELDRTLVSAMIEEYGKVKRSHFLGDHEKVMISAGKFCETVFQLLEYITSGSIVQNPSINGILKRLEGLPKDKFQDSIRIIIPWATKTAYSIRSKRGSAHRHSEISPNNMDSSFVVSTCDWIVSELVRLYYTADESEIIRIIEALNEREIPIVERIDNDLVVLRTDLPIHDEILVVLHRSYPSRVDYGNLRKWVKRCTLGAFSNALRKCIDGKLIHETEEGYLLTAMGTQYVESRILFMQKHHTPNMRRDGDAKH
jgi:hypothetical protein